ncbi:MAG TPA: hypothetical protein VE035_05485 [Puia sp.]|nr:hypothetical protein [Puia sp.]
MIARGLTFTLDGYWVKVKNRIVLPGLFSQYDATLPASFTSQIPPQVTTVQFFANAVNATNYGLDIAVDFLHRSGGERSEGPAGGQCANDGYLCFL